jgi:sulfur relay (sulfurtransferase) complex TusBCD TusD component (DsrE family)
MSKFRLQPPSRDSGRPSWPLGLAHLLAVLIVAALIPSAQAQNSVTLAWDPDPGSDIAGYRLYEGGASRTYTNVMDVGIATNGTFSGLASGATYFFAVTAYNTNGLESDYSTEVSCTVPLPTNNPPVVTLTSPANNAAFTALATISLAATVTANGHAITKVQFYSDTDLLSEATNAPYVFTWSSVPAGIYSLSAQVVYDSGSTAASPAANVTVTNQLPPSIALTAPANNAAFTAPAIISLAANVAANGHSVSKVQFYNGTSLLGEAITAPYAFSWGSVSAGIYSLSAQAVYDSGSAVASTAANVTVTNLPPPTIALTSPANNAAFTASAAISLAANVTANGHAITQVQFYSGATLLGEATTPPTPSPGTVSRPVPTASARRRCMIRTASLPPPPPM